MLAATECCGELISTARTTSKADRITFQDWVRKEIENETLCIDSLVEAYQAVGGAWVPTHIPYDPDYWPKEDKYHGKMLYYTDAHRYILISYPYEHQETIKWRIDTHFFQKGRIWLWDGMPKSKILEILDQWAYRSRSKYFCWVISFLMGAFFCTQCTQRD